MGVETAVALGLAALSAGVQYENTQSTNRKQDRKLADNLRRQGQTQRKADARVNDEVQKVAESRSDDERRESLDSYMTQLRANRGKTDAGLTPNIGSDAFRDAAAGTSEGVQRYAADTADLMSRIDAPGMQRRGEGFAYGNLATDLGLIGRESAGQSFIDDLRLRAIRRSAGKDAFASLLGGAAGAVGGMGGGGMPANGGIGGSGTGYFGWGGI